MVQRQFMKNYTRLFTKTENVKKESVMHADKLYVLIKKTKKKGYEKNKKKKREVRKKQNKEKE